MTEHCLIIGASHAAAQACVSLRQGGWSGDITVVGDEPNPPYHRPPLSKDFLSGEKAIEDILIRPLAVYDTANIKLRLNTRVASIDRASKTVTTDTSESIPYTKLILTTGARIRRLPVPGEDLPNVFYLRDTKDVLAIKDQVSTGKQAVIIGGGYIGLETAASLRKKGMEVTVLEAMPRILQRVTAPELSAFYKRVHTEEGVTILENVGATEILQDGNQLKVLTGENDSLSADMVIIGIGVIPNTELAEQAGLEVGNGIVVNEYCQTLDENIYAIGDVTWHHNSIYDTHLRLESVPNATEQAKTAALHINGTEKPYKSLPWFWSDQFDLKLQIAGLSTGYDDIIIRGDNETSRSFAAFYFKGDQFIAVDAVNDPRAFMFSKMALTKGQNLDKTKLASLDNDLKSTVLT